MKIQKLLSIAGNKKNVFLRTFFKKGMNLLQFFSLWFLKLIFFLNVWVRCDQQNGKDDEKNE